MSVDMHVHTSASDGTDSPQEVVKKAKGIGLRAIAITDHDTFDGIEPAVTAGQIEKIEIIPGIELGSEYNGEEIHILGYFLKTNNQELLEKLELFQATRITRMEKMIKKLREYGFSIDINKVLAISGTGTVGRPHLAAAMVDAGAVKAIAEAFDLYIGHGRPAYIPRFKLSPADAVRLIRRASGVPVLAHPGLNKSVVIIKELIDEGLAGLEVYHPAHSREQEHYYRRLANENGLLVTGGSDYHGPEHKAGFRLGARSVPYETVKKLNKNK